MATIDKIEQTETHVDLLCDRLWEAAHLAQDHAQAASIVVELLALARVSTEEESLDSGAVPVSLSLLHTTDVEIYVDEDGNEMLISRVTPLLVRWREADGSICSGTLNEDPMPCNTRTASLLGWTLPDGGDFETPFDVTVDQLVSWVERQMTLI